MPENDGDLLRYYAQPGPMTNPCECAALFEELPKDIAALRQVVQGLMVHIFWAERYGLALQDERKQELHIRPAGQKVACILEMDGRPLSEARPLEKRLVGNCRDFSVLACSMLRYQGVPARARCGFATYFLPNHYEDHWVVEYWKADEGRWVMADFQLDDLQKKVLGIEFDTLDMPPGYFWTGGKAWLECRAGHEDPDKFGIFEWKGLHFIRGDLLRDYWSLNKIEILPWDFVAFLTREEASLTPEDDEFLDEVAKLCVAGDPAFSTIRRMYEDDPRLHIPEAWLREVGGAI
jgi:hypothetical protein